MTTTPLGPMTPMIYEVADRTEETSDTVTMTLAPVASSITAPAPGQFSMLWAFGVGEAPISVADSDGSRLIFTIRGVGPVTDALCGYGVGEHVGVRGPYGHGWDLDRAIGRDVVIIAGGLGLAPVRLLIDSLLATDAGGRRRTALLGARSPDELLYLPQLERWGDEEGLALGVTVDAAGPSWRGNVGLVTQLLARAEIEPDATTAYLCGPEVMMRFAARDLLAVGCPPSSVYVSLERNMHCAVGHCGHCQLGPAFLCKDGPVLDWATAGPLLAVPSL